MENNRYEIILHVVHYHHAKIAHLAPNEGAWRESGAAWLAPGLSGSKRGRSHVANPGQLGWLKDCPDPNEGARLLLTQASWLQDHVVHCL
jgi:hypothetical protein